MTLLHVQLTFEKNGLDAEKELCNSVVRFYKNIILTTSPVRNQECSAYRRALIKSRTKYRRGALSVVSLHLPAGQTSECSTRPHTSPGPYDTTSPPREHD